MKTPDTEFIENIETEHAQYLNDESGIIDDGTANRLYFPKSIEEVCHIMTYCYSNEIKLTVSGGGTGLSGGRVPHGGWILATDKMTEISSTGEKWVDPETNQKYKLNLTVDSDDSAYLKVPVSMTLKSIQNYCRQVGWFYPPDPTERSSFIGGNVATNASGARSFKFGATRDWVHSIKVVLPEGRLIELERGSNSTHQISDNNIIIYSPDKSYKIPIPKYELPNTQKNVAGPILTEDSDVIDLFIGTDGIFGIIVEVTLKLIRPKNHHVSIFAFLPDKEKSFELIEKARLQRDNELSPVPMSVEYLGPRAVAIMKEKDPNIPDNAQSLVILEQDADDEEELYDALEFWVTLFDEIGVADSSVAQSHKEIEHHKKLRHIVPETVNTKVKGYGQSKLGTDYSVPSKHFRELFNYIFKLGEEFEEYQNQKSPLNNDYGYAFWAHAGDSHVHLNFLPRDDVEMVFAKKLVLRLLKKVVNLNGSIAAEHGLGKKYFDNKPAIQFQYSDEVINQFKKMKEILDSNSILNDGNLFG